VFGVDIYGDSAGMITYAIAMVVKGLFLTVVFVVRTLFGTAWTVLGTKVSGVLALEGVSAGLGLVDLFVGLDFIVWATGLAVTVVITIRLIRLIMGVFSKA
jgi:hypothetical protein